ncbi:hypothetical protein PILCRDRAFT_812253 [Piloderma croceum F 1598]|uniref:Uncharacterized protein n=1 Tax=Piloderma croceum (strain F 1598) TaxID=765440 RepID=A0A0C3GIN6_PILCF|nr:hypothetical protein PILCRDRAFT_812253 [Piloderma croceum F 1598]
MSTTYLKTDTQTIWARNAVRRSKLAAESGPPPQETRRGSNVIVIHPGSRSLRIGKASDVNPVSVPNVIARKSKETVPEPIFSEGICRPRNKKQKPHSSAPVENGDEYAVTADSDDPFDAKIAAITVSLRDRMRFYKLKVTPNAANIASTFNEPFMPEIIQEYNDPFSVDWITDLPENDEVLVGEKVLRLADPHLLNYTVRWPIHGAQLNTRDYSSLQLILSDLETIIEMTLQETFKIERKDFKDYSVLLLIPDFYERPYVQELTNMILVTMGFKQICVQQESLAATYGAGISSACVVDIGAVSTSIACVDEGLVIADTRMSLNLGGDDITEFLYVLLNRISFPYRDINLARWYDWNVIEDLKTRLCTLAEGDVALNLYDFIVRRPNKPAEKYGLRAYDEIILAPMCIFEPRVIDFDNKRVGMHAISHPDVTDEIIEHASDHATQAMMISTQHLMPTVAPTVALTTNGKTAASTPQPPSGMTSQSKDGGTTTPGETSKTSTPPLKIDNPAEETADVPMDIDIENDNKTPAPPGVPTAQSVPPPALNSKVPSSSAAYPGGHMIDVGFEASKLPLDVAIFNSSRAAGGDDKIRKYLQAVLVIGGTALLPGMAHALESRLQAIATPLVPNMEKVQIIPPAKDVDQRVLAWKGAAVLGKMDGVSDLWLTAADWDVLGMRGLKERCFYL